MGGVEGGLDERVLAGWRAEHAANNAEPILCGSQPATTPPDEGLP